MLYNVFFSANGRTGVCADFVAGLLANDLICIYCVCILLSMISVLPLYQYPS